jgi:hypothetical protein
MTFIITRIVKNSISMSQRFSVVCLLVLLRSLTSLSANGQAITLILLLASPARPGQVLPHAIRFTAFDHAQAVCTLHVVQFIRFTVVQKLENAINRLGPFRCSIRNSNDVLIA